MRCKYCKTDDPDIVKKYKTNKHSVTRLYCWRCEKYTDDVGAPKILIFDIETSKGIYKLYRTGKQFVGWRSIDAEPYVMGWAGKWLFGDKTYSCFVTPEEAKNRDDERVIKMLHKMLSMADMVITHNGDRFDIKQANPRFTRLGLLPVNGYVSVDTLKKAKQIYDLQSYSLEYMLKYFGCEHQKMDRGGQEATDLAEAGDPKALKHDEKYCKQDVWGLEELYLKMRGYMKTHPNMSIYYEMYHPLEHDENYCPRCLEVINRSHWIKKIRTPSGTLYKACSCPNCGAMLRLSWKV